MANLELQVELLKTTSGTSSVQVKARRGLVLRDLSKCVYKEQVSTLLVDATKADMAFVASMRAQAEKKAPTNTVFALY